MSVSPTASQMPLYYNSGVAAVHTLLLWLQSPELAIVHIAQHLCQAGSCNAEHLCSRFVKLASWARL